MRATRDALLAHGAVPSTRQIAEAAGVAEGTIFRAFGTKEALLDAVVERSFDPEPFLAEVDAIDPELPLRQRLYQFVELAQARFQRIFGLMSALGMVAPPYLRDEGARRRARQGGPAVTASMTRLIGDDADQLTVSPEQALHLLRLLTFAGSHPHISQGHILVPTFIVDSLLDGIGAECSSD